MKIRAGCVGASALEPREAGPTRRHRVALALCALTVLPLLGCAAGGSTGGLGIYGNFCGPGRPGHSYTDAGEVEKYFETIEPFDYIDCACREHDLCYARNERNDPSCDALFDYLVDNRGLTKWCRSIAFELEAYFDYVHPNRTIIGSVASTALFLPTRLLLIPFDAIDAAQAKASGELGQPCSYRPELVQPFMSSWKALRAAGRTGFTESRDQRYEYDYYLTAASKGHCSAWATVGEHHEDGRGVPRDIDKAIDSYRRGSECGHAYSTYLLGQHTLMGTLPGGEMQALKYFESCQDGPGGQDCDGMAKMLRYKQRYVEPKYAGTYVARYPQCRGLGGGGGGWLRRWTSPGPKLYR